MRTKIRWKVNAKSLLEYVLAFLLVLECNTVYQRMTSIDLHLDWMCIVVAALLMLTSVQKGMSRRDTKIVCSFLAFFVCYLVLTFTSTNVISYISLFCIFFPLVMLYLLKAKSADAVLSIYQKFSTIVVWLTGISTIVWAGTELLDIFSANMNIRIMWGTDHVVTGVFGLFFQCQMDTTFGLGMFYRNSGIFCEAPMFSLVATFALLYELFLHGERRKFRIFVLCIGILSAVTSTGIVMLGVCLALVYWKQMKSKRKWMKMIYIIGMIILIPVAYILLDSLLEMKSLTGSYSIRMVDYMVGFRAFLRKPMTGTGFNNLSNLIVEKADLLAKVGMRTSSVGFSNSMSAVLGQGGILMSLIYLLSMVGMIKSRKYSQNKDYTAWVIAFLVVFTLTIFHAKFIMMYFLAMGYSLYSIHRKYLKYEI